MAALVPASALSYLLVGSAVISAVGAVRQGQANAAAAEYNAKLTAQNQQISEAQGIAAGEAQQRDAARRIGASVAAYGASGVQLSEGSPLDVLEESARNSALDAATVKYNYRLKSLGFENQSRLYSAQSGFASSAGYLNAGAAALSGAAAAVKFGG